MYVAKTKVLIAFTVHLICGFVFPYAKNRFSHDAAHIMSDNLRLLVYLLQN